MHEQIQLYLNYARIVWCRRWVALVAAFVFCAGGWAYVLLLPDVFEVKARIFIDTRSLLTPLLKGLAVDNAVQRDTAMMVQRTLLVRPNLEKVARKTDMNIRASTPREFEQLLIRLSQQIKVSGTRRDNIFVITYQNNDARLAADVVDELLTLLVERSLGEQRKDTSQTREFLEQQIGLYERRLNDSEAALKDFKQRNVGLMPSEGQGYYAKLESLRTLIADSELMLSEATNRAGALELEIKVEPRRVPVGTGRAGGPVGLVTAYDERVRTLTRNLDELLLQYTERHPDVVVTRRLLEEAKAQQAQAVTEFNQGTGLLSSSQGGLTEENPYYRDLKLAFASAQGEVAALKVRVQEYRRRATNLEELVDTVPRVEAELAKLNRDYEVLKTNHEELVKRLESLKISDEAGQSTDVQFNVIEPPRIPLVPVSPDRQSLSLMVLAMGLAGGVGLAALLGLVRPAVYTQDNLRELTALPVLGVVSRMWTPRERWRRRIEVATFAAGCMSLLGVFGLLMVLYSLNVDIVQKVGSVGRHLL